jgi:hypothetical protein
VCAFLPVRGEPLWLVRAFVGDPGRWLPDAAHSGPDTWTMTLRAGAWAHRVETQLGDPWRSGLSRWRSLSWDPVPSDDRDGWPVGRLLPSLDGELGLYTSDGDITLVLDGRYRPPGGAVGAAIDRVALHRVARGTTERLLSDIAGHLVAEAGLLAALDVPAPARSTAGA